MNWIRDVRERRHQTTSSVLAWPIVEIFIEMEKDLGQGAE